MIGIAAFLAGVALAPPPPPPLPPQPVATAKPEEARALETPTFASSAEDVALFVPRLVLTPPRLVLTMVFFPVQHGLRFLTRNLVASDSDPTNDDVGRSISVLPHVSFLSGFGATVGGSAAYSNLAGWDEQLALGAAFGGRYAHAIDLAFRTDRTAGSRLWLETGTRLDRRPQEIFRGFGDRSGDSESTRFREDRLIVRTHVGVTTGGPGGLVKAGVGVIAAHSSFGPKDDGSSDNPSIEAVHDTRALVGFDRGVTTVEPQVKLVVDTRDAAFATSSGAVLTAFAGGVPAVGPDDYAYGHFGIDATGTINLFAKTRVLMLRGLVESVDGASAKTPFSRLPTLGGSDRLRGYRADAYRDGKAALVSAEYRYPIHQSVAGALFVDAGHVSHGFDTLLSLSRWRAGVGAGVRVRTKQALLFAVDVAYGEAVQVFLTVLPRPGLPDEDKR